MSSLDTTSSREERGIRSCSVDDLTMSFTQLHADGRDESPTHSTNEPLGSITSAVVQESASGSSTASPAVSVYSRQSAPSILSHAALQGDPESFDSRYEHISKPEALRQRSKTANFADPSYVAYDFKRSPRRSLGTHLHSFAAMQNREAAQKSSDSPLQPPQARLPKFPSPIAEAFEDSPMLSQGEFGKEGAHDLLDHFEGVQLAKSPANDDTDVVMTEPDDEKQYEQGYGQGMSTGAGVFGEGFGLGIEQAEQAPSMTAPAPYRPPMFRNTDTASSPSIESKIAQPEEQPIDSAKRARARELAAYIRSGQYDLPPRGLSPRRSMSSRSGPGHRHSRGVSLESQSGRPMPNYGPRIPQQVIPDPHQDDHLAYALVRRVQNGTITADDLKMQSPFANYTIIWHAKDSGIVRVTDIPYNTTRQEIIAFFGRNVRFASQPPDSPYYGVHVNMERGTAKSMDGFVEFVDQKEAMDALGRALNPFKNSNRKPRIGDRVVSCQIVPHAELMEAVFPRAKCVTWIGQQPEISEPKPTDQPFISGFKGFITSEEMHMVAKFSTNPSRSRFAGKHPQRTYESLITLMVKYPYWVSHLYTVGERDAIFTAVRECVGELARIIEYNGSGTVQLNPTLLEELLFVGLQCPIFTEPQRFQLMQASRGIVGNPLYVGRNAMYTPFMGLQRRPDCSEQKHDVFMHYMQVAAYHKLGAQVAGMQFDWSDPYCCIKAVLGECSQDVSFAKATEHEVLVVEELMHIVVELSGSALEMPAGIDLNKPIGLGGLTSFGL